MGGLLVGLFANHQAKRTQSRLPRNRPEFFRNPYQGLDARDMGVIGSFPGDDALNDVLNDVSSRLSTDCAHGQWGYPLPLIGIDRWGFPAYRGF